MWIAYVIVSSLISSYFVYGSQNSLTDEEIIQGGKNISIFLWGFIFTLLSIVVTWYYFNQEEDFEPSATKTNEKEVESAKSIVKNPTKNESEKSAIATTKISTKVPIRAQNKNLVVNLKTNSVDDGETSILCSKYDWEDKSRTENGGKSGKDRFRRHSMEEMNLIFPGFLPKITEEADEVEEEEEESVVQQLLTRVEVNEDISEQQTHTPETSSSTNEIRGDTSVNTPVSKTEPEPVLNVIEKDKPQSNDTNAVAKEKDYKSRPNTQSSGCIVVPTTDKILREEPPVERLVVEALPLNPETETNKEFSGLDGAKALDEHANDGHAKYVCGQQDANLEAEDIISGRPNCNVNSINIIGDTTATIVNGYLSEKEMQDIKRATPEDKDYSHFTNDCEKEMEIVTESERSMLETKPSPLFGNNIEVNNKANKTSYQVSQQDTIILKSPNLENVNEKNEEKINDITDCYFNGFTNILNRGNISELPELPVMGENLNNTHAWTFFSMSSEAEKNNVTHNESEYLNSFRNVERPDSLEKIGLDLCDKETTSVRIADISETKENPSMNPDVFETDIDVDDSEFDEKEQLTEDGELNLYFKRPVSVTNLDEIIETAESKIATVDSEREAHEIVDEKITQKQTSSFHNEITISQVQETNLDTVDNFGELKSIKQKEINPIKTKHRVNDDQNVLFPEEPIQKSDKIQNGVADADIGSTPDEVSIAIVTLETVCEFEETSDTSKELTSGSKTNTDPAGEEKIYEQNRIPVPQELPETTPEQVENLLQSAPESSISELGQTGEPIKETIFLNTTEVTETTPNIKHELQESFVAPEDTYPSSELPENSISIKAQNHEVYNYEMCEALKESTQTTPQQVEDLLQSVPECSISQPGQTDEPIKETIFLNTTEVTETTPNIKHELQESPVALEDTYPSSELPENSFKACVSQKKYELSEVSQEKTDIVSDSENLSFSTETPEIIKSDEASEIEDEFADHTIVNPTRTRSKYLVSGITRIPERRSKSFSLKSFGNEGMNKTKKSDLSTKLHLEKDSQGGLRIILTGKSKDGTHPKYMDNSLSKSTEELHDAKVQEISYGVEETVFQASHTDVTASPENVSPSSASSLHSSDFAEPMQSPKIYTAKITMQENLPDRRRIIVLNVRKKSPSTARWKSMNDLDQMRSAITNITKEFEENPTAKGDRDQDAIMQKFRADTPVEIMVPYKKEETCKGQTQDSNFVQSAATPTSTVKQQSYEVGAKHETRKNVSKTENSTLLSLPRGATETVFALSAEPFSEKTIVKQHESLESETVTKKQAELINLAQETTFSNESEPSPFYMDFKPDISAGKQDTGKQEMTPLASPVNLNVEEKLKKETTFAVYSKMIPGDSKPEHEISGSIFNPQASDISHPATSAQNKELNVKSTDNGISSPSREEKPTCNNTQDQELSKQTNRSLSPVVVERKIQERKGKKETVFVVSAEPYFGDNIKNNPGNKRKNTKVVEEELPKENSEFVVNAEPHFEDSLKEKATNERNCSDAIKVVKNSHSEENPVFGVFAKSKTLKATPLDTQKVPGTSQEITVREVSIRKKVSEKVVAKEIRKTEKTTHVEARLDPASETIVNVFSDDEDNVRSPYRHVKSGKPMESVKARNNQNGTEVIQAFPVNDGQTDEELDDVFVESRQQWQCQTQSSPTDSRASSSASRHHRVGSYDADSETSSVQGELTPKLVRLHHVKTPQQTAGRKYHISESDTDESSTTPTNFNSAPYLDETSVTSDFEPYSQDYGDEGVITSAVVVGSKPSHPQYYEGFSPEERLTGESTEEEIQNLKLGKMFDDKLPVSFGSAFRPVDAGSKKSHQSQDVLVPRARSASTEKEVLLSSQSYYNKGKNKDEPNWENMQNWRGLDSGKSMPNLYTKEGISLPNTSNLNPHTRMWLSQNTGIDFDGEDVMTSELFLYPSSQLDLTTQDDMSDTLSTRPQSPMSEFSYAGEVPYAGSRRDSKLVLTCANSYCHKEEIVEGVDKTTFTSCPACYTYYCSRDCRRINWREHKKVCFFGKINSYIRSFVYYCNRKEELRLHLSKIAKSGFKKKDRGCVMVMFSSPQLARNFMTTGCKVFPSPPTYSSLAEVKAEGAITKHRVALIQSLEDYDPCTEFVLNLAILVGKMKNTPDMPEPRHKLNTVLHCVRLSLSNSIATSKPTASLDTNTETKIFRLPKCARHEFVHDIEARRHYCRNISKSLKQYGIRLKHDYPDAYEKMCLYVERSIDFEPLTVYGNSGSKIVLCKIMPETSHTSKKWQ